MTDVVVFTVPAEFVAVIRNVVVCVGATVADLNCVTSPIPLSMVIEVAPETAHDRVVIWPAVIDAGFAANELITGNAGVGTGVGVGVGTGLGAGVGEELWSTTPPKSVVQYHP